jgi:CheY-like chemotaxis protein
MDSTENCKNKSILLIEDNKDDQYFFTKAIHDIESASLYHVANNGQEAICKLKSADRLPDIIFTDINMPLMDGIECLSQIKKMPAVKHIPLVVLSTDTSRINTLEQMGVRVFIEKPSDLSILKKLIEHVLGMDFSINRDLPKPDLKTIFSYPT